MQQQQKKIRIFKIKSFHGSIDEIFDQSEHVHETACSVISI